jgi:hypothetical protein
LLEEHAGSAFAEGKHSDWKSSANVQKQGLPEDCVGYSPKVKEHSSVLTEGSPVKFGEDFVENWDSARPCTLAYFLGAQRDNL